MVRRHKSGFYLNNFCRFALPSEEITDQNVAQLLFKVYVVALFEKMFCADHFHDTVIYLDGALSVEDYEFLSDPSQLGCDPRTLFSCYRISNSCNILNKLLQDF